MTLFDYMHNHPWWTLWLSIINGFTLVCCTRWCALAYGYREKLKNERIKWTSGQSS